MKHKMRLKNANELIYLIVVLLMVNITLTSSIQRFKRPDMTTTELFLMLPQNFIYHFNNSGHD